MDYNPDSVIQVEPNVIQLIQIDLAGYCVATDHRKTYHIYKSLEIALAHPKIIEMLEKDIGKEKYQQVITYLRKNREHINRLHLLLNNTDEHTVKTNDINQPIWKKALEEMDKVTLIDETITKILVKILIGTNMRNHTIKKEQMYIHEKKYKKVEIKQETNIPNRPLNTEANT